MAGQPVAWTGREAVGWDGQAWKPVPYSPNENTGEVWAYNGAEWVKIHEPSWLGRQAIGLRNLVTGQDRREENLPELGSSPPGANVSPFSGAGLSLAGAYALTPDTRAIADIAQRVLPGATVTQDRFGNDIVEYQGRRFFVNAPGLSGADIFKGFADLAQYAPAARLGMALRSRLLGVAAAGGASALTSLAQDRGAQALGSEQPADLRRAAATGAVAAAARFVQPEVDRFVAWATTRQGAPVVDDAGRLTERGRDLARRAGLDPEAVNGDLIRRLSERARTAADPGQAARVAEAETLPVPVPLRQGQVTGDPAQQMFENLAEKGAYGEQASLYLRGQRQAAQQALRGNVNAIQGRLSGGTPQVLQPGQGGAQAQAALDAARQAEQRAVGEAYQAARAAPRGSLGQDFAREGLLGVRDAVIRDHNLTGLTRASALMDDLLAQADRVPQSGGVPIRALFDWRQRATAARAAGGEDAVALGKMIRGVDDVLDRALENALVSGDDASIGLFRQAIGKARDYFSRWEGNDLIQRLTERDRIGGVVQLVVPPDRAARTIFGARSLFGPGVAARDIARLKSVLQPADWNAIREEAWLRLVEPGIRATNPTTGLPEFSGTAFQTALNRTLRSNAAVMRELFTPEEIALMQQFGRVAARATGVVRGGDNFSNTTPAMAGVVQRITSSLFTSPDAAARWMALPIVRAVYSGVAGLAIPSATAPTLAAPASGIPLLAAPIASQAVGRPTGRPSD